MLFTREILMIGAGVCIFVIDELIHICSDGLKNFTLYYTRIKLNIMLIEFFAERIIHEITHERAQKN